MGSKMSKGKAIAGGSKSSKPAVGKNISKYHTRTRAKITREDEAILDLKRQRDIIRQYQRQILANTDREKIAAKKALEDGNRERALLQLKKKRFRENLIHQSHKQLENIEEVCQALEFAQIESKVLDSLALGNEALKNVYKDMMSIEQIEKLLGETQEEIEKQNAINQMLSDHLSSQDIQDVELELANLISEDTTYVEIYSSGSSVETDESVQAVQKIESENDSADQKIVSEFQEDTTRNSQSDLNQVRVSKLEFPEVPGTPMPVVSSEVLNKGGELVLPEVSNANPSTSSARLNSNTDTDNYVATAEHKHKHKRNQKFSESTS